MSKNCNYDVVVVVVADNGVSSDDDKCHGNIDIGVEGLLDFGGANDSCDQHDGCDENGYENGSATVRDDSDDDQ